MKTLTNKNRIKFDSKEEMEQYIQDNELMCLGSIGKYYGEYSYINSNTNVTHLYIYNFYVIDLISHNLIKHNKLKIYYQSNGGYYVLSKGQKCWVNSFWNRKTGMFITGEEVIKNFKERGV